MEVTFKFSADPNRCITVSGLKRYSSPSSFEAAEVNMARRSLGESFDIDRSLSIDGVPPTAVTVQDDVKTCGLERRQDARMTDPLHDIPLKALLQTLVEHHGWEELGRRFVLRCFLHEPAWSRDTGEVEEAGVEDSPGTSLRTPTRIPTRTLRSWRG